MCRRKTTARRSARSSEPPPGNDDVAERFDDLAAALPADDPLGELTAVMQRHGFDGASQAALLHVVEGFAAGSISTTSGYAVARALGADRTEARAHPATSVGRYVRAYLNQRNDEIIRTTSTPSGLYLAHTRGFTFVRDLGDVPPRPRQIEPAAPLPHIFGAILDAHRGRRRAATFTLLDPAYFGAVWEAAALLGPRAIARDPSVAGVEIHLKAMRSLASRGVASYL